MVYRDRLKDKLLKEHGIRIIRIKHDSKITKTFIDSLLE